MTNDTASADTQTISQPRQGLISRYHDSAGVWRQYRFGSWLITCLGDGGDADEIWAARLVIDETAPELTGDYRISDEFGANETTVWIDEVAHTISPDSLTMDQAWVRLLDVEIVDADDDTDPTDQIAAHIRNTLTLPGEPAGMGGMEIVFDDDPMDVAYVMAHLHGPVDA